MATGWSKLVTAAPAFLMFGHIGGASAEVATDGTAGPRGRLDGPDFEIPASLGRREGGNLFHSFATFSIRRGESATFSGPAGIENMISRVTGGEASTIDGALTSTIPGADFYFLNPAGIAFGPNARLDLQGSFHVSTADELRFADGAKFSANLDARSSFTVEAPQAFGFLGRTSPIRVRQSVLEVPTGETFSLIGGDVSLQQGVVRAEAGTVQIAAIGGIGAGRLADGEVTGARLADVRLRDRALIDARGDGGGKVVIRGGRLVVDHATVAVDNTDEQPGIGGLDLNVRTANIRGGALTSNAEAGGSAGSVTVVAERLTITDDGRIDAEAFAAGRGGNVTLGLGKLEMRGSSSVSTSALARASDRAGDIVLNAESIELRGGSRIAAATLGPGEAGDVTVKARVFLASGVDPDAEPPSPRVVPSGVFVVSLGEGPDAGAAGSVILRADSLRLHAGAQIGASTFGPGAGGDVMVNAREVVAVGADRANGVRSGLRATSQGTGKDAGDGGSINLNTDRLVLRGGRNWKPARLARGRAAT
jgi:filamentous hemagglutinin family protein